MSKNSEILIICQMFYPELISTGQTLTEFAESLVQKGRTVSVVCGPRTLRDTHLKTPKLITHKSISIRRVWSTQFSKLSFIGKLVNHLSFAHFVFWHLIFRDLRQSRLIVLTNPPFLGWLVAALSCIKMFKFDYLIFDLYPDTAIECKVISKNGLISKLWNRLNNWVYDKATTIIVIGRCMKERLLTKLNSSQVEKIRHLPMWCDTQLMLQTIPDIMNNLFRKRWGKNSDFLISYSGNLARFHDINSILLAAKSLNKTHPSITFCFIGEGYRKQEVVSFIDDHNLTNCYVETYVERDQLASSLSAADVGLVSLMNGHEGLSVPSKTYGILAVGNPVLGLLPEQSEIAKLLIETPCGLVSEPLDWKGLKENILFLYNNPSDTKQLGKNGQQSIKETYHVGHATDRYIAWIKE